MSDTASFAHSFVGVQNFCDLIKDLPIEWRGPIFDVADTFYIVNQALMFKLGIDDPAGNYPELFLEAVRLTFERHKELKSSLCPE